MKQLGILLLVWAGAMFVGCKSVSPDKEPETLPMPAPKPKPIPKPDDTPKPDGKSAQALKNLQDLQAFQKRTFLNTYRVVDPAWAWGIPYDQRELYPDGYEATKRLRSPYQLRPTAPFFHQYDMSLIAISTGDNILFDQPQFVAFFPTASMAYVPNEIVQALQPYQADITTVEIAFVPQLRVDYCTDVAQHASIQFKAHQWVRPETPEAFVGNYFNDTLQFGLFTPSIPAVSLNGVGLQDVLVGTMRPINVNTHDNTISPQNAGNIFAPAPLAENGDQCFFSAYSLVVYPAEHKGIVTLHWILPPDLYNSLLTDIVQKPGSTIADLITYAKANMADNVAGAALLQFPKLGVTQLERLSGLAPATQN